MLITDNGSRGGKIHLFTSSMCLIGPHPQKNKDNPKIYNSDGEVKLFEQEAASNAFVQDCLKNAVGIDIYVGLGDGTNTGSIDLATLANMANQTGGLLHYQKNFNVDLHGERLHNVLYRALTRPQALDVQMKARVKTGLNVRCYYGSFGKVTSPDFGVPCFDADSTIAVHLENNEKLKQDAKVAIQFACLYTDVMGVRKIRVLNV